MKFSKYIFIILVSFSAFSCSDDVCNEETKSTLNLTFNVKDEALTDLGFVDNLSIYSPEWTDSIHFSDENESGDSFLGFMLSPYSDTSEIIITSTTATEQDTLIILTQREQIFLSKECGFITKFLIDTVLYTLNYIDSIEINEDEITTAKNGEIQLYF